MYGSGARPSGGGGYRGGGGFNPNAPPGPSSSSSSSGGPPGESKSAPAVLTGAAPQPRPYAVARPPVPGQVPSRSQTQFQSLPQPSGVMPLASAGTTGPPPQPTYRAAPPRPVYNASIESAQRNTLKKVASQRAIASQRRETGGSLGGSGVLGPATGANASPGPGSATPSLTNNSNSTNQPTVTRKDGTFQAVIHRQNGWLFSAEDLESTPSILLGGLSESQERAERTRAMRFLERVARSLRMMTITRCTACLLVQRFYMRHSFTDVPYFDVVAGAVFLASKLENDYRRMRDVIMACWRRCNPRSAAEGPDPSEALRWQETIISHEQQLLLDTTFDLVIQHPFPYMVDLADRYTVSPKARELAWIALVDSYETILLLRYSAIAVAGAALFAVCEFLNQKLGGWGEKEVWDLVREMEGDGSTVTELTIRSIAREVHLACKVLLESGGTAVGGAGSGRKNLEPARDLKRQRTGSPPPVLLPPPPLAASQSSQRQVMDYSDLSHSANPTADLEDGEI